VRDQAFKAVAMLVQILEEHAAKMVCPTSNPAYFERTLLTLGSLKLRSQVMDHLPLVSAR
jgi:hypothetical protein